MTTCPGYGESCHRWSYKVVIKGGKTCKILKINFFKMSSTRLPKDNYMALKLLTTSIEFWCNQTNRIFLKTIFFKSAGTITEKFIHRSSWNFAHIFSMILLSMWTYIFSKVYWKNYFIEAKIIAKFGQKFKLFL